MHMGLLELLESSLARNRFSHYLPSPAELGLSCMCMFCPRAAGRDELSSSSHGPRTDSKDATGSIQCATTPASAIAPSLARR